jgi:hypothetical protein
MDEVVNVLERLTRFIYKWITTEDEILGEIIYILHTFGFLTLLALIIISHTIYPDFWFQFAIFCVVLSIWLQHVILKTCIITCLESKFIKNNKRVMMIDGLLNFLDIPINPETQSGVTLIVSTGFVVFLGLELISRSITGYKA